MSDTNVASVERGEGVIINTGGHSNLCLISFM